jgi:hypothetical protein
MMESQLENFHRDELRALRQEWEAANPNARAGGQSLSEKRKELVTNVHEVMKRQPSSLRESEESAGHGGRPRSQSISSSHVDVSAVARAGESPERWADRIYDQFGREAEQGKQDASREAHLQQMRAVVYAEELKSPSSMRGRSGTETLELESLPDHNVDNDDDFAR